jgi:hypothetical protein
MESGNSISSLRLLIYSSYLMLNSFNLHLIEWIKRLFAFKYVINNSNKFISNGYDSISFPVLLWISYETYETLHIRERRVVNMLLRRLLPLYNETMERLISASKFSKSEEAKFRLSVVEFSKNRKLMDYLV